MYKRSYNKKGSKRQVKQNVQKATFICIKCPKRLQHLVQIYALYTSGASNTPRKAPNPNKYAFFGRFFVSYSYC